MRNRERKSRNFAKKLRNNMPRAEVILWTHLRRKSLSGFRFRRQHPIGPYIADFACVQARLILEIDGATHSDSSQIEHDQKRVAYIRGRGWAIVRLTNDTVYNHLTDALDAIFQRLPPPRPKGRTSPVNRGGGN